MVDTILSIGMGMAWTHQRMVRIHSIVLALVTALGAISQGQVQDITIRSVQTIPGIQSWCIGDVL